MNFKPYFSVDIETTGLADKSEMLQISVVYDNGGPIDNLLKIDLPIKHEYIEYCEPYAMGLNADLLKKMMSKDFKTYTPKEAIEQFLSFVENNSKNDKGEFERATFAGKNVGQFDLPKLKSFVAKHGMYNDKCRFERLATHRVLDVGSIYFDVFGKNASLSEINSFIGRNEVSHNALEDALDVVYAIRHKLSK